MSRPDRAAGCSAVRAAARFMALAAFICISTPWAIAMDATLNLAAPDRSAVWTAVNDGVMGGVSTGAAAHLPSGDLVFSGEVSLANNGGFASVRRTLLPLAGDVRSFRLALRGDGRRYRMTAYTEAGLQGLQYSVPLDLPAGAPREIEVKLADFRAAFRGRPVPDAPALLPGAIRAIGFIIGEQQAGPFRLEVTAIEPQ